MNAFKLLLRFPSGSVLIGGHAPAHGGVHAEHARLPDGRPFLPPSAIRGALRESLEGLLRASEEPACAGGDGVVPKETPKKVGASGQGKTPNEDDAGKPRDCSLDGGRPCRACRLFGGGRRVLPDGEKLFSALVLGEGLLVDERPVDWQSRFGVAIDRRRQSAADHRLLRRMVPEPGLVFVATGRLTSDEESLLSDFKAAVRATTHIGSGRSGGLARVEMELQPDTPAVAIDPLPPGPSLEIAVELTTPASLGVPIALGNFRDSNFRDSNFRDTRRWVPGSALRGAVGFALAEILDNPDDPDFQALVHEDKGAIFDFLYPVDDLKASPLAAPWPITAQSCKAHREHGVFDTLLSRIAVRTASGLSDIGSLGSAYDCPICKGPPGGLKGNRRAKDEPGIQIVTRVAMDRKRASARDGMLFSCAQVERGTRFVGQIRGIPERGRARLAQALRVPLSVGRGRSMGWGSLKILGVSVPPAIASIQERGRDFDAALPALCAGRRSRLVVLTLLSPLVIDREQDDGRATLSKAMGVPISSWPVVARKFDLERGWDQRRGLRDAVRVARAGSVFVGELPEGTRWQEILPALQRIEAEGAGQRTRMGFGRVICFDPLIYQGAKKP